MTDASFPSFLLASPDETVRAFGVDRTLRQPLPELEAAVWAALEETRAQAVVGALPFEREASSHLLVPRRVERTASSWAGESSVEAPEPDVVRISEQPSRQEYEWAVRRALAEMMTPAARGTGIDKVVLSRMLEIETREEIDVTQVVTRLLADRTAHVFWLPLTEGRNMSLVGASPELLVEKRGRRVTSLPMAGSAPRRPARLADEAAARQLFSSAKDQGEHRFVVQSVLDTLAPFCGELSAPPAPVLTSTSVMWHLATPIEGVLKRDVSVLELVGALHPTPAVCGTPRDEARALIASLEPFERRFFTGTVGWCDRSGDGRWVVAIRCAEIERTTARLYAGAGIVNGSVPQLEADETAAKFNTLLRGLGVEGATTLVRSRAGA